MRGCWVPGSEAINARWVPMHTHSASITVVVQVPHRAITHVFLPIPSHPQTRGSEIAFRLSACRGQGSLCPDFLNWPFMGTCATCGGAPTATVESGVASRASACAVAAPCCATWSWCTAPTYRTTGATAASPRRRQRWPATAGLTCHAYRSRGLSRSSTQQLRSLVATKLRMTRASSLHTNLQTASPSRA